MRLLAILFVLLTVTTALAEKIDPAKLPPLPTGKVRAQVITQVAQLMQQRGHGNTCLQGVGQLTQVQLADRLRSCLGAVEVKK